MQIRLATRGSRLALAQAGLIADQLRSLGAAVELVRVRTLGDVSAAPLSSLGGIGVFAAAVREAVLAGACDLAVHSLKDLPTAPCPGLTLAAVPRREDPRDALCARAGLTLSTLPRGAAVGTGSPRRAAQLRQARPDLRIIDLRGNVDTRLGRIEGDLDAVVLAVAGLRRIGTADAITEALDLEVSLPAPGQGALALECREDDVELISLLRPLDDADTRLAVEIERSILRILEAGCSAPFAALATAAGDRVEVIARVSGPGGNRTVTDAARRDQAEDLAASVAARLGALAPEVLSPGPLAGVRVLMPPIAGLLDAVRRAGASVVEAELTTTQPIDDPGLDQALADLAAGHFDWLALTSARTIASLAATGHDLASMTPAHTRIAAVGPATAAAAARAGLHVDLTPSSGSGGAELADAFPNDPGAVLIPGAADPAAGLDVGLAARGARVTRVAVYRTVVAERLDESVIASWPDGFDAFVAAAGSGVRAAKALLGLPGPQVVALGETTARAALDEGFDVAATATSVTGDALVAAIASAMRRDLG